MTDTPGRLIARLTPSGTTAEQMLALVESQRELDITRMQLTNASSAAITAEVFLVKDREYEATLDVDPRTGSNIKHIILRLEDAGATQAQNHGVEFDAIQVGVAFQTPQTANTARAANRNDGGINITIAGTVSLEDIVTAVNTNGRFSARLGTGNSEANGDEVTWAISNTAVTRTLAVVAPANDLIYRKSVAANATVDMMENAHPIRMERGQLVMLKGTMNLHASLFGRWVR